MATLMHANAFITAPALGMCACVPAARASNLIACKHCQPAAVGSKTGMQQGFNENMELSENVDPASSAQCGEKVRSDPEMPTGS